jgi:hypothetical protein
VSDKTPTYDGHEPDYDKPFPQTFHKPPRSGSPVSDETPEERARQVVNEDGEPIQRWWTVRAGDGGQINPFFVEALAADVLILSEQRDHFELVAHQTLAIRDELEAENERLRDDLAQAAHIIDELTGILAAALDTEPRSAR